MARTIKLFKLPAEPVTPGLRPMEQRDIPQVRLDAHLNAAVPDVCMLHPSISLWSPADNAANTVGVESDFFVHLAYRHASLDLSPILATHADSLRVANTMMLALFAVQNVLSLARFLQLCLYAIMSMRFTMTQVWACGWQAWTQQTIGM